MRYRVLLTGAAGFTGRVTLDQLRQHHDVTALDLRPVEGHPTVQVDVLEYEQVEAAMAGHDAVVNTITGQNCSHGLGFTVNVTGFHHLLEAARVHQIKRVVHTSSAIVHTAYRSQGTFRANDLLPLRSWGGYAISKILQEELARNAHDVHGLSIAMIRPWGIIDADRMVDTAGEPVEEITDAMIDRRDVASALRCALEAESIGCEAFYVMASRGGYHTTDVAKTEERLGWKPTLMFDGDVLA